jgi:hypothetical protein
MRKQHYRKLGMQPAAGAVNSCSTSVTARAAAGVNRPQTSAGQWFNLSFVMSIVISSSMQQQLEEAAHQEFRQLEHCIGRQLWDARGRWPARETSSSRGSQ